MAPRSVAVLALPGVQLLDVAGPLDVFAEANAQSGRNVYDLAVVGTEPGPIITSSGRGLVADLVAPRTEPTCFDTLLVAGAPRIQDLEVRTELLDWLVRAAARCRRYGSICSGAFLLGQAGLLRRRRVTTHWAVAKALAERAGMSPRHFARLFRAETGLTPAAYVETVRIESVRRLLETGDAALKQVAGACGFRDADTLRRAFMRRVGTTPAEYRRRHVRP
ncbi:GlxA family transcriptional regulator [Methylobacterium sp. Gmos1]